MSALGSPDSLLLAPSGYEIKRSLRFNDNDTAYLSRTPSSATNRRTFTFSCWVKRSTLNSFQTLFAGRVSSGNFFKVQIRDDNRLEINTAEGTDSTVLISTPVYRDVSAWYHIVIAFDTTQATSTNRVKFYVNGTQVENFDTSTYPPQNTDTHVNNTGEHLIGNQNLTTRYFDGYMAEVNFVDGTALDETDFGETDEDTGAWIPKKYSGSYGTNGFYLNFSDNSSVSALGTDSSGNGNTWTPNNFSVTAGTGNDSLEDTPTNNWCTWNPLRPNASMSYANGNLDATSSGGSGRSAYGTIAMTSGKWYFETTGGDNSVGVDVIENLIPAIYLATGSYYIAGSTVSGKSTYTTSDVIGVAYDADANTIEFFKNGVSQGSTSYPDGAGKPVVAQFNGTSGASRTCVANFGQRAFDYTPPTGFKALNTANLPEPTIKDGTDYFNTVLYTGDDSVGRAITVQDSAGNGWQPDFVWVKARNQAYSHHVYDSVRGASKRLLTNGTQAEFDQGSGDGVTAFNPDGFDVSHTSSDAVNQLNTTYAAFNWLAGGSTESLDTGSITSTVSRNVDAGFSIVSYTGNGTVRGDDWTWV